MPTVHPSAILDGDVRLADDVSIGPGCVLTGPVTIGAGTRLLGHVHLEGPLTIGERNLIYPFCTIGFAPQAHSYDPGRPGRGVRIGHDNTFREGVTIHRAMTDERPTTVGDHNLMMVNSHAGHDVQLTNRCTLANGVLLGGHVEVQERVVMGGNSGVHQFCRLGRGCMVSGSVAATMDVPPFFMVTGFNTCGSLNLVGMRRSGMTSDDIEDVKLVYRTLYRRRLAHKSAVAALREHAARPLIAEYLAFIDASKRGICSGHGSTRRALTHA